MVCISLTGALPNSQNATFHKCMAAFLNSVSCLHPPQFHMSPPWALCLLLESIKTLPYEPMQADKLTWMSLLKVSLFFCSLQLKKVWQLYVLLLSSPCVWWSEDFEATSWLDPGFLPKVISPNVVHQQIYLAVFHKKPACRAFLVVPYGTL